MKILLLASMCWMICSGCASRLLEPDVSDWIHLEDLLDESPYRVVDSDLQIEGQYGCPRVLEDGSEGDCLRCLFYRHWVSGFLNRISYLNSDGKIPVHLRLEVDLGFECETGSFWWYLLLSRTESTRIFQHMKLTVMDQEGKTLAVHDLNLPDSSCSSFISWLPIGYIPAMFSSSEARLQILENSDFWAQETAVDIIAIAVMENLAAGNNPESHSFENSGGTP